VFDWNVLAWTQIAPSMWYIRFLDGRAIQVWKIGALDGQCWWIERTALHQPGYIERLSQETEAQKWLR